MSLSSLAVWWWKVGSETRRAGVRQCPSVSGWSVRTPGYRKHDSAQSRALSRSCVDKLSR